MIIIIMMMMIDDDEEEEEKEYTNLYLCFVLLSIHILLTFHLPSPCLPYLSLYPYCNHALHSIGVYARSE
jgi:hypothetical protein